MGEGTHTNARNGSRKTTTIIVAGSAVALLVSGILFQVFRPEQGGAAEKQTETAPVKQAAQAGPGSQSMARVNGQLIKYDEVARECVERYGKDVLDNMINRRIVQQACVDAGVDVTSEEVHAEILRISKRFNLSVDAWYQMLQSDRDVTPLQYQRDIIWPMLALRKLTGKEIEVSNEDVVVAFEREYGPKVKARMIMFDNIRRAQTVWGEAVKDPENFDRLAREHSIEPNSRALGGSIPPIRMHSGNDELEKAAFKLNPGEISGIIQLAQPGANRYVILMSEGQTKPAITELEDVRETLVEQIREAKVQEAVAQVFENLKDSADIDNYLTNTSIRGDKQAKATGTKSRVQQASGTQPATK